MRLFDDTEGSAQGSVRGPQRRTRLAERKAGHAAGQHAPRDVSTQPAQHSAVRAQYLGVKRAHPDAILFFRMGDFYEMFDEDAELVARELELTLTKREWGQGERSAMAGVPHHAAQGYIARLVAKGYRVAVCEQMSDPALSKGLVERDVTRVVTPGTVVDPAMLAAKRNNYLAAAVLGRDAVGLAYADITTGEFACTQVQATEPEAALLQELARVQPAEVLVEAEAPERVSWRRGRPNPNSPPAPLPRGEGSAEGKGYPGKDGREGDDEFPASDDVGVEPVSLGVPSRGARAHSGDVVDPEGAYDVLDDASNVAPDLASRLTSASGLLSTAVTPYDPRSFKEEVARDRLREQFGVATLEAFGCEKLPLAVRAAGAVVAYLRETQRDTLAQITALETYSVSGFMTLDAHTRRNLELFESGRAGGVKGSLLWVLDATRTPMGGRRLRKWLGEPLLDLARLRARQDAVADALADSLLRARLTPALGRTGDLERLTNRVVQRIATPRDLVALATGLRAVEELLAAVQAIPAGLSRIFAGIQALPQLRELIERAIVDEPPLTLAEGGAIRAGYSEELDTLLDAARNARQWVADLERSERERTGIANLRVGYNKVFGYYLEVTNSQLSRVPEDFIRKQTLTTGERFITPALKEFEAIILNASEKSAKLEQELFAELRARVAAEWAEGVLRTARSLAELDVTLALAEVAARNNYCRPELDEGDAVHIVAGRHPVVEASLDACRDAPFVPNDTELATSDVQILLLTGPNMAGKSTYLRQVALITLMAQIGSFVPAEAARIGLVDRIFTRIGAQDDLATGQSTFMVEMVETANILHHATPRSLVILDEIGRGTSTYDGLAIARAIVEYLHNNKRCGAKTLFATHYHELVEVARILPRVRAYNVAVTEDEGEVVFLRKIVPGGADKSYGIHVAQLAGIPRQVVRRAEEVLEELERKGDAKGRRKAMREMVMPAALQLTLFAAEPDPLVEELKALAVDELTPLEALTRLYELQRRARER